MKALFTVIACIAIFVMRPAFAETVNTPSDESVVSFAALSSAEIFHFGFNDIAEKKTGSRKYFTTKGYESFYEALEKSKIPEIVAKNRQLVSGVVTSIPVITEKGTRDGMATWKMEFPFLITYQHEALIRTDELYVTPVVAQSDDPQNVNGLGIVQWIAMPGREPGKILCSSDIGAKAAELMALRMENRLLKDRLKQAGQ